MRGQIARANLAAGLQRGGASFDFLNTTYSHIQAFLLIPSIFPMRPSAFLTLHLLALLAVGVSCEGDLPTCLKPIERDLLFGCQSDYDMADHICCHNAHYAEPAGYLNRAPIKLFQRLDPSVQHTFYDPACTSMPLFKAPIARNFAQWKSESLSHGWPSFRKQEVVAENIVVLPNGEVRSKCGLHLGHNLPDVHGDRYCINLVCIAGNPVGGTDLEAQTMDL